MLEPEKRSYHKIGWISPLKTRSWKYIYHSVFLSRFWVSKWHPKILQWHPKFWTPRYGFALYWSKTIWDKHIFLHVAVATDGCNVIGRHNFLAQKLEAKIVSLASLHCHVHRFASASYYTAADFYSMVYATAKAFLMQLWKCFTVSPLQSSCLAMHQTTMKTKGRQLQRACKTRRLSSEATVKGTSQIMAIWAALKQL